jgi:endogenous inhibitor of DNA gyrase (YacG/DUF329 family)
VRTGEGTSAGGVWGAPQAQNQPGPSSTHAAAALEYRDMKSSTCPICKGPCEPAGHNATYPFCGPRCKLADLSNWLSERYAVDGDATASEDDDSAESRSHADPGAVTGSKILH